MLFPWECKLQSALHMPKDLLTIHRDRSRLPVRRIVFLGAPHRGLDIKALRSLVKGEVTEPMILELQANSPTLRALNQSFAQVAQDVDILTCYENKPTKTAINVCISSNRRMSTEGSFRSTASGSAKGRLS